MFENIKGKKKTLNERNNTIIFTSTNKIFKSKLLLNIK